MQRVLRPNRQSRRCAKCCEIPRRAIGRAGSGCKLCYPLGFDPRQGSKEFPFPFKSVYCDESGNSGPNLIDEQQPCYVLAGVLSPSEGDEWLVAILDELRRDYNIVGEFKGSRLLERARGWRLVGDLVAAIAQRGGLLMYHVVEKRYAIAAKVVE